MQYHKIHQGVTTCGLSSLASFLKILSSKRVCCVFRDIRNKNAVNQGFWSETTIFSLPATKMHYLLIFGFHTCTAHYSLAAESNTNIHQYVNIFIEDWGPRIENWGLRTGDSFTPSGSSFIIPHSSSFLIPQSSVLSLYSLWNQKILKNWKNPH